MFPPEELRKFTAAGRTIAAAVGASVELWARAEAGVILKTWAGRTRVATQEKADRRSVLQVLRGLDLTGGEVEQPLPDTITVNAGLRGPAGRVWVRSARPNRGSGRPYRLAGTISIPSGAFRPERYHQRRGIWIDIMETVSDVRSALARAIPAGRRTIGLGRQSVVQIADDLGLDLATVRGGGTLSARALAKAREALARDGRRYQNGYARQERAAGSFVLELVNRYPRGVASGMDATLAGVIAGRLKFFRRNLEEGTFLSAARAAKAYPYLAVLKAAA